MAVPLSKSELDFALQALRVENVRVDGRALTAYRRLGIRFGAKHGEVEVNFGPSRAFAVCSGEIVAPNANRPREGRISFHVEFGPLASPSFEVGRPSAQAISVANFVERLLRGSRAIDAEALCIVSGQKVWSIRVDVRAMDDDGNLSDVCAIAALCALLHFRKADVEVKGDSAEAFAVEERAPVPLSVHHLPVPVTFALFGGKETEAAWVLDPNRLEEAAMSGSLCIAVNQHGELCGVHKPGGLPVDLAMLQSCMDLAKSKAKEITGRINSELEADLAQRQQAKRNVHQQFSEEKLLTVDWAESTTAEAPQPVPVAPLPPRPVRPDVRPAAPPVPAKAVTEAAEVEAEELPAPAPAPPAPKATAPKAVPPGAVPAAPPAAPPVSAEPKKNRWKRARKTEAKAAPEVPAVPAAKPPSREMSLENLEDMEDDGRDLDAELEAMTLEAAELEKQLEAAEASEMAFLQANAGDLPAEDTGAVLSPAAKKKRKKKIRPST